jgi:hypothetical protein
MPKSILCANSHNLAKRRFIRALQGCTPLWEKYNDPRQSQNCINGNRFDFFEKKSVAKLQLDPEKSRCKGLQKTHIETCLTCVYGGIL